MDSMAALCESCCLCASTTLRVAARPRTSAHNLPALFMAASCHRQEPSRKPGRFGYIYLHFQAYEIKQFKRYQIVIRALRHI